MGDSAGASELDQQLHQQAEELGRLFREKQQHDQLLQEALQQLRQIGTREEKVTVPDPRVVHPPATSPNPRKRILRIRV